MFLGLIPYGTDPALMRPVITFATNIELVKFILVNYITKA